MILTISHRTTYRYARPVMLQPHRTMLCPRGQHDLRLLRPVQGSYAGAPEDFVEMIVSVTVSPSAPPAS